MSDGFRTPLPSDRRSVNPVLEGLLYKPTAKDMVPAPTKDKTKTKTEKPKKAKKSKKSEKITDDGASAFSYSSTVGLLRKSFSSSRGKKA